MASRCRRILAQREYENRSVRESRSRGRNRKLFKQRSLSLSQDVYRFEERDGVPFGEKRSRSLASLVESSKKSVHNLIRMFENMTEGRKSQIVLLDERRIDILIQSKLSAKDLLDLVASHVDLKEKEYFGLYVLDERGHRNWLHLEKKVLDHDFPRQTKILLLHLGIKFYIETIAHLRDRSTIELSYLNAKQAVYKNLIECDSDTVFELAAHVLQVSHGDYINDETTRNKLKTLQVLPTSTLKEHPYLPYCEEQVNSYYQKLIGTTRGLAIVNYMTIVETLPTYGIHYYEVKDKKDIPWWLGLSYKGISVYDKTDKRTPRRIFSWKELENLYYRDKKFSVEVHDQKRVVHTLSSFSLYEDAVQEPLDKYDDLSDALTHPTTQVSVSRRGFGPGNVNVHAWFGATSHLTKCIWSMAVAQHQFYLERKHNKVHLQTVRSMSEIAAELSHSSTSLSGSAASDLSRSTSSVSLPSLSTSRYDVSDQAESAKVQRELHMALKARKEALEETLRNKTAELKLLCIKEGELIGHLPKETPLDPGEQPPTIRRRVTTAFSLSKAVPKDIEENEDLLAKLELEYELQSKIASAVLKLAHDKTVGKTTRRQRKYSYQKAQAKLKEMEKNLNEARKIAGQTDVKPVPTFDDRSDDSLGPTDSESEMASPAQSPPVHRGRQGHDHSKMSVLHEDNNSPQTAADDAPFQPGSPPSGSQLSPSHSSPQLTGGYMPSSVYITSTQYRNHMYPTLSSRGQDQELTSGRFDGSHDSGFSSANNMCSLAGQRTSQYESGEEVKTPTNTDTCDTIESTFEKLRMGSLEESCWNHPGYPVSAQENLVIENMHLQKLVPSKFGSKRESQSDYDEENEAELVTPRNSTAEMEHMYKQPSELHIVEPTKVTWQDTLYTEPSPILHSPQRSFDEQDRPATPHAEHSYSPRGYEISYSTHDSRQGHHAGGPQQIPVRRIDSPSPQHFPQCNTLVTVKKIKQPFEVTKPFETSDFFKYSEKLRRQRRLESYQRQLIGGDKIFQTNVSQHISETDSYFLGSASHHSGGSSPSYSGTSSPGYFMRTGSPSSSFSSQSHSTPSSPFTHHWKECSVGRNMTATSYQAIKSQATHVQYSVQSVSTMYKSHHIQTMRHTHYQPPQPMTCEPIRDLSSSSGSPSGGSSGMSCTSEPVVQATEGEQIKSSDSSFSLDAGESLAEAFSEEMLAWYEDQDRAGKRQQPTLV